MPEAGTKFKKNIMACVLKRCHCKCLVISHSAYCASLLLDITCVVYAYCKTITALSITGIHLLSIPY